MPRYDPPSWTKAAPSSSSAEPGAPLPPDASGFDRWRSHRFGGSSVFRGGGPLYDRSSNQYGSTYGEAPKHDENGAVVHDQEAAAKAAWLAKADAARGGGGAMSKDNQEQSGELSGWDRWQSHRFGGSNMKNQGGALYDRSDKGSFDKAPEQQYGDASGWDRWQSTRFGGSNMKNQGGALYHRSDDQYGSTYGEAPKAAEESKEAQAA